MICPREYELVQFKLRAAALAGPAPLVGRAGHATCTTMMGMDVNYSVI